MASKKITFDPTSGVPYAANLTIYTGSNFTAAFNVVNTSNAAYDLTNFSLSSQMQKSAGGAATTVPAATFTCGITSAVGGTFNISLGSTATTNIAQGRYLYNILAGSGATVYSLANGNILVYTGISSSP